MARRYSHIVIGAGAIGSTGSLLTVASGRRASARAKAVRSGQHLGSSGDHSRITRRAHHREEYTKPTDAMYTAWMQVEERSGRRDSHA